MINLKQVLGESKIGRAPGRIKNRQRFRVYVLHLAPGSSGFRVQDT